MAKMMLELSHDEVNREIPYVMVCMGRYRNAYIRAYARMIEERRSRGLPCDWQTGEDVLHWSLEDGVLQGQMVIEGMEE